MSSRHEVRPLAIAGPRRGLGRREPNSSLRMATEAAEALSTRIRRAGVLERMAQLETAAKEAGARLAGRWEPERAARAQRR